MKHSISPYPMDVRVNQNNGNVFIGKKWIGHVGRCSRDENKWESRKANSLYVNFHKTKTEAVNHLIQAEKAKDL